MTERELDALRALRREHASVPDGALERGRRRLEALLEGRPEPPRRGAAGRRAVGRFVSRTLVMVPALVAVTLALAVGSVIVLGHHQRRVGSDTPSAVPYHAATKTDLIAMFAVLRRPQSDAERALVHRAATDRYSALPKFSDPGSVRILAPGVLGRDAFLYLQGQDSVCVYYPDVEGGGITCPTAPTLDQVRMIGALGTEIYGLVPDGVSQVDVSFPTGQVAITTRNNFWQTRARGATPTAIVWKDAQGREIDPAHASQQSHRLAPTPPKIKVTTTNLHTHVDVLSGHRVRFTPPTGRYRYEIALHCGRSGFDGAVTKPLPAGRPATVPLKLAAARDQCPGRRVFAGKIVQLQPQEPRAPRIGRGAPSLHVVVLGTFKLSR